MKKAFTLIELMVTFALLAVMMTSVGLLLTASLRAAKKGLLTAQAKTEGQYAVDVMSNMLRYATAVSSCPPGSNTITFTPRSADIAQTVFRCDPTSIASDSSGLTPNRTGRLTSNKVELVAIPPCSITCSGNQVHITFGIKQAGTANFTSEDVKPILFDTQITLRNL